MLEELRITSLGVIEESVLELGPGLTVVTGETGAGKTMVVSALGLLLGGRADSGAVRAGARSARIEGTVVVDATAIPARGHEAGAGARAPQSEGLPERVEEAGGEVEDGRLLLVRQISAEGRSRAQAGGATVPVSVLTSLADGLIAVHGQSDQHRLLQPATQREALDRFAGVPAADLLARYRLAYQTLQVVERELADVVSQAHERAREADMLRFGLEEIESVDPRPGEDEELRVEEERLGFADTLRAAAELARQALSADDGPNAIAATAEARKQLDAVREHDPAAAELADRLAEVSYLLTDLAAEVASYASDIDDDPVRLAAVSERRSALLGLTRKYGETVAEVLAWAESASRRLLELDGSDALVERLRGERERLREEVATLGAELSGVRREAAGRLAATVSEELTSLAMPHAAVTVDVRQTAAEDGVTLDGRTVRFGPHGLDEVDFLLAANQGAGARPLGKGASGGELSRVMLALEVALAATNPVPTLVFDEVDAGVGGKAAVEVGRRLAVLARHAQVLVVTHLPQVAAFADRHVVVVKSSDGSITSSGLTLLDEEGRVRELSRMLAGLEDSETALAHAQELLQTAQEARTSARAARPGHVPTGRAAR